MTLSLGPRSFGHAQLLDDVLDHWDAAPHMKERKAFIKRLQYLARARGVRVSFVSGDVHVCAVGRLYSRPKARAYAVLIVWSNQHWLYTC